MVAEKQTAGGDDRGVDFCNPILLSTCNLLIPIGTRACMANAIFKLSNYYNNICNIIYEKVKKNKSKIRKRRE